MLDSECYFNHVVTSHLIVCAKERASTLLVKTNSLALVGPDLPLEAACVSWPFDQCLNQGSISIATELMMKSHVSKGHWPISSSRELSTEEASN